MEFDQRRADLIEHLVEQHGAEPCWAAFPSFSILKTKHKHVHHPIFRKPYMDRPDHCHVE